MCNLATFLLFNCISNFNCYFIHVYIVTVFTLISGICSSVICLCNCAVSFVLLYYYIVTLVRLSLVTIKGYLLACLMATTKPVVKKKLYIPWIVCFLHSNLCFQQRPPPLMSHMLSFPWKLAPANSSLLLCVCAAYVQSVCDSWVSCFFSTSE